jgi:tetratricopeptide (TPR) repeat protein
MALEGAGDIRGAEHELTTAFGLDPRDYAAEFDLALVHEQQGNYQQAAQEADDALRHLPNAPASAYITLGQMYDAAGAADRAQTALAQAARLPGGESEVALARARITLSHKDAAGAERQLRAYLAGAPDDPAALMLLGSALAMQARFDEALGAYQRALTRAPDSPNLRFLIALTLHNLGRNREALGQCQLVLRAAPENPNAIALMRMIERDMSPINSGMANRARP